MDGVYEQYNITFSPSEALILKAKGIKDEETLKQAVLGRSQGASPAIAMLVNLLAENPDAFRRVLKFIKNLR